MHSFCHFMLLVAGILPQDHDNQHRIGKSFPTVAELFKMVLYAAYMAKTISKLQFLVAM